MAKKPMLPPSKISKKKKRSSKKSWIIESLQKLFQSKWGQASACIIALYVAYLLNSPLHYLDPSSTRLKEVFYGRQPWIILCNDNDKPVPSVFEATSRKKKDVSFGVLNCAKKLPSEKTTYERLKLNQYEKKPIMFFSGYGRDVKQLKESLLRNEYALQKQLTHETKVHAAKVRDTEGFIKKCLKKTPCALVLTGADLDSDLEALKVMNVASDASPSIKWVYVDASKLRFSSSGSKLSEKSLNLTQFTRGQHRVLMLGKYTGPTDTTSSPAGEEGPMLFAKPYHGRFSEEALTEFVASYIEDPQEEDSEAFSIHSLELTKRRPPQQPRKYSKFDKFHILSTKIVPKSFLSTPAPSNQPSQPPSPDQEATILPTAQIEENKRAAEARRIKREAEKRAQMDAEAEDVIEADEDEEDGEDDEDYEDEDEDEDEEEMDLDE